MSASENSNYFQTLAPSYDSDFTRSITGAMQRKRVWHLLEQETNGSPLKVLEINCGTGEDAYWLCKQGHHVLATDASEKMIEMARSKTELLPDNKPDFLCCPFHELNSRLTSASFDLIFSNFAGLNCVNTQELEALNKSLAQLLKPKGKLIMILLGKKCWTERLYFWLKRDAQNTKRRKNGYALAMLHNGETQPTWYYSLQETTHLFSAFQLRSTRPIGLFIPPSYLEAKLKAHQWMKGPLRFLESVFGSISALADYGDHIYISLIKN